MARLIKKEYLECSFNPITLRGLEQCWCGCLLEPPFGAAYQCIFRCPDISPPGYFSEFGNWKYIISQRSHAFCGQIPSLNVFLTLSYFDQPLYEGGKGSISPEGIKSISDEKSFVTTKTNCTYFMRLMGYLGMFRIIVTNTKSTLAKNSYCYCGAAQWNSMPQYIRNRKTLDQFKVQLKKWILTNVTQFMDTAANN